MPRFLRRHRGACLLIAGTDLLRGAFLWATRDDAVFRVPYLDGAFYQSWARSLAAGHGDFQGPYFLPPLYPQAMSRPCLAERRERVRARASAARACC